MAVAGDVAVVEESLAVRLDDVRLDAREVGDAHGGRLHRATGFGDGRLAISYDAVVDGVGTVAPVAEIDLVRYARPSRYCESDLLAAVARAEFGDRRGADLVAAVDGWVRAHLEYLSGSGRPTDGAIAALLARRGVCRDFAHVVIALLRALDVPARLAAVYAPGLTPMDFHAVAEVALDGEWHVIDATALAPRQTMLRIATGRDAADTAFLTTGGCEVHLTGLVVSATTDEDLPYDEPSQPVRLG